MVVEVVVGVCMARCEPAVSDTAAERYLMMEGGGE